MDKKARRVTWAAGVVSPRPRSASRRARRRARQALLEAEEAACAQSSLLLPCPPNDGDMHLIHCVHRLLACSILRGIFLQACGSSSISRSIADWGSLSFSARMLI